MTKPLPPFTRADAVYFLAAAGAHLAYRAGKPDMVGYSAGAVCEALATLGVSHAELSVAAARGKLGHPDRWDDILTPEPEKEPRNDNPAN